jgi:hypothetical protein
MSASGPTAPSRGRLGRYAPVPFVGAATLLVALIVFTPVLFSGGPSPITVQARLTVDRVVSGNETHLYVGSLGGDVRYLSINLSIGTGFNWSGGCPTTVAHWTNATGTQVIELGGVANATTAVVFASATYVDHGSTTIYAGELALNITHDGAPNEAMLMAACSSSTPGFGPPTSWPVSDLPLSVLLVNYGAGGPPP